MAHRRTFLLFSFVLVAARPAVADGPASDVLDVTAEPPVVTVTRSAPGRRLLSLPSLQYTFAIGAQCRGNTTLESLSINVADSRLALSAAELRDAAGQPVTLTIPADQIAPIAVNDYCELPGIEPDATAPGLRLEMAPAASRPTRVTVGAALSAQVSLLCSNESERHMIYVAQPLDVTLSCETPAGNEVEPELSPEAADAAPPLRQGARARLVFGVRPEVEVEERE